MRRDFASQDDLGRKLRKLFFVSSKGLRWRLFRLCVVRLTGAGKDAEVVVKQPLGTQQHSRQASWVVSSRESGATVVAFIAATSTPTPRELPAAGADRGWLARCGRQEPGHLRHGVRRGTHSENFQRNTKAGFVDRKGKRRYVDVVEPRAVAVKYPVAVEVSVVLLWWLVLLVRLLPCRWPRMTAALSR